LIEQLLAALNFELFRVGGTSFTVILLVLLLAGLVLIFVGSKYLQRLVSQHLLRRTRLDMGAREAVGTIVRYIAVVLGFLILLPTAGINLSVLAVVAGAVGIGVGFGLQTIADNFISGIIIMFERPIKVGDRIEVGDVHGQVTAIKARATTVLTNDNISVIVPNSRFISENVVNWTHSGELVRFRVEVGVAYGSDVKLVSRVLLDAARKCPDVLDDPEPTVRLKEFGDSALVFQLLVWSSTLVQRRGKLLSDVNFLVHEALYTNDIVIPFPQRDLHLRTGWSGAEERRS
jgi:small-conductance mechanosensitive channel